MSASTISVPSLPSLFLAHGAPDLPLTSHIAKRFMNKLAQNLPEPRAILIISAHWETTVPTIGTAAFPTTIYDFNGFPSELRELVYPARTDKTLINRTAQLLNSAGIESSEHPTRGYDHGAWIPLLLTYPKANVPVVQLSLQFGADAKHHFEIGQALAPLRKEGVLIIGSGATVHNLSQITPEGSPIPAWAQEFDDWLFDCLEKRDLTTLLKFPHEPATARAAHPSIEHFLPIYVAMGAGWAEKSVERVHHSFSYGSISMATYAFGGSAELNPPSRSQCRE